MRLEKTVMVRVLDDEPSFAELFLAHLLSRNIKIEEDLVDQLFNSSEKRLARVRVSRFHVNESGASRKVGGSGGRRHAKEPSSR